MALYDLKCTECEEITEDNMTFDDVKNTYCKKEDCKGKLEIVWLTPPAVLGMDNLGRSN